MYAKASGSILFSESFSQPDNNNNIIMTLIILRRVRDVYRTKTSK